MVEFTAVVRSAAGLHARPAAQLVALASSFSSTARLDSGGRSADLKSIMSLLALGVTTGTQVTVSVDGADEVACAEELEKFIQEDQ